MNIETVNEIIASLESAGDLSIKETKVLALAKAYQQVTAERDASLNAERAWEAAMMEVCGEDGPASVAAVIKALTAENVGLKAGAEFATAPDMWIEQADGMLDYRYCDWYVDVLKAAMETPATDRIYAGIKADGVEKWVSSRGGRWNGTTEEALKFAKQLREGAK